MPMVPEGLPRLLPGGPPDGLAEHLNRHGPVPFRGRRNMAKARGRAGGDGVGLLIDSVEKAGLTGRGGADFPAARKMRAVLANSRPVLRDTGRAVVVANGAESEPISAKDRTLLANAPHLVLDGISLAAESVAASEAYLCVDGEHVQLVRQLEQAVAARQRGGVDAMPVCVTPVRGGYVASEESALVHLLNGGPALPTFVPPRPFQKGVRGRPTLVSNVETLAHVALIARYGPGWFRAIGTSAAPGSALVTVAGAVREPGVHEIALGTSVRDVIAAAGGPAAPPQAILGGGYFGGWLPASGALDLPVSGPSLRAAGASLGAGILAVLPEHACGIAETARIARYLAGQSAGQCGPCMNGLPAIAEALERIAWRGRDGRAQRWLTELLGITTGRGACHLPDGMTRLVTGALHVFAADLRRHVRRGPCDRAAGPPAVPVPGAATGRGRAAGRPARAAARA